jgi:hypothetical protein
MIGPLARAYTRIVHRISRAATATAALVFLWLSLASIGRASAAPVLIDAGNSPVIAVQLRGGQLTVRTWNRNQVQIDAQGPVDWFHATARQVANNLPTSQTILAQTAQTPNGPVTLPPETFVLPQLSPGPHEGVRIVGDGAAIITIPQGTALVLARVGFGGIDLQGYHQGAFFAAVRNGDIALRDVSGTGFAQVVKGPILVDASSFDRIRARTGTGMLFFEGCTSQQIELTSVRGSIAYDNGSFQPGLARFESQYGNIALGIGAGGAQVTAHGANGRVYTEFGGRSNVSIVGGDARGAVGGGGPTVTASAANGAMLVYDGALRDHPSITAAVPEMRALLSRATSKNYHPAGQRTRRRQRPPF